MAVRQSEACIYNIPTKDIHVALFLTDNLKFSYDFKVSKPKRSKRLYICLAPRPPMPQRAFSAQDDTKIIKIVNVTPVF